MHTFESSLSREDFFKRMSEMEVEGLVVLKERLQTGDRDVPTGFVLKGVRVVLWTTPKDVVWVGLGYDSKKISVVEMLIKKLELTPSQAYPLVVEQPSKEVKEIWGSRKK